MTTIVVGVTNHSSALAACQRAFELARPGDQIHLVYAVSGRGTDAETAHRHADGLLETLQLSSNRPVSVHTVHDEPHQAILDVAARTEADLIVIGNRGMVRNGRFTKAPPARVLRGATCSVLVVDTGGAAALTTG
jgi:nucleotide-binding universal stress UspA family protein